MRTLCHVTYVHAGVRVCIISQMRIVTVQSMRMRCVCVYKELIVSAYTAARQRTRDSVTRQCSFFN